MSQFNAGDVIAFTVDGVAIDAKIEDASKSDVFLAKITGLSHASSTYRLDQVYEFNRNVIK